MVRLKLIAHADVTACAQLRVREKKDSKWTDFICGIDVKKDIVITTFHHLWGYSIKGLVEQIIITDRNFKSSYHYSEFDNLDNIIELVVCDDSQALQSGIDYDDPEYYEKCSAITEKCREELKENPKAFDGLTQQADDSWEGTIEI